MANERYLYKVYKGGVYQGALQSVISDFGYSQDINTSGPQLPVTIAATLNDAGATQVVDILTDENGNNITDQYSQPIYTKQSYVFTNIPIDLANRVIVYRYDDNYINGTVVFDGLIYAWQEDEAAATTTLTVQSYGIQLDNYEVKLAQGTVVASQNLTDFGNFVYKTPPSNSPFNDWLAMGQTFTLSSTTVVQAINLVLAKLYTSTDTVVARLTVSVGVPGGGGQVLASATRVITAPSNRPWPFTSFTFPSNITLIAGVQYSFVLTVDEAPQGVYVVVGFQDSDVYPTGTAYLQQVYTPWHPNSANDVSFRIIAGDNNTTVPFLSQDPSNMLKSILNSYQSYGGRIGYDSTTVDLTSTTVSYTFKSNTVYEGVNKVLELAPANWYWFIDPGTNMLHFHRAGTVADHIFYKRKHLITFNPGQTLEGMKNTVSFTGGDTGGGVNLYQKYSNTSSTSAYGNWLARQNDNRVTLTATADTLARGILDQNGQPSFRTELEVSSAVYDTHSIRLGHMVGFRGYNGFTDSLLLQVVGHSRKRGFVHLRLASSLPSVSHRIEDIRRNLDSVFTLNNPTS